MIHISKTRLKGRALLCRALLLVLLGVLAPLPVSAQTTESLRGMYIDGYTLFRDHDRAEQEFVDFVRDNKITYVAFYLRPADVETYGQDLSDLINTLRSTAGVLQVGATTGPQSQVIVDHNNQYSGKFDVINLELEFWQDHGEERVESFHQFTSALDEMNEIAAGNDLLVEAYIGWISIEEMAGIVARIDRLLLHTYVSKPEFAYGYGRTRFEMLSELQSDVPVMPIYSVEKTEGNVEGSALFMGQWMIDNSPNRSDNNFITGLNLAESTFEAAYNAAVTGPTNLDINLAGHHYFSYANLANLPPTASKVTPALNHIVVESGSSAPIEFTMSASDKRNLLGVEWYQSGKGHIGTSHFGSETTNTKVINAVPPYSVSAVPFDSGQYGRPALYAKDAVTWHVLAQNTLPTATPAFPKKLDVYLNVGETQTFIHQAKDIDGNLFATDWYGHTGYLGRSIISGNDDSSSRDIQFNEAGTFTVSVDLFDRAVYMPDNEIRQNKIGRSVRWTVHVGTGGGLQPVEPLVPAKLTGRYVMVRKAGTGTLSLTEVEVREQAANGGVITSRNLALKKHTAQSTTAHGGVASRAVDGVTDGFYTNESVSHTEVDSSTPWWRVDLGATYDVARINIHNRTDDCCNERLDGAVLYIGNTPSTNPADYTVVGVLTSGASVQQFTSASANSNEGSSRIVDETLDTNQASTGGGGAIGVLPLFAIATSLMWRRKRSQGLLPLTQAEH